MHIKKHVSRLKNGQKKWPVLVFLLNTDQSDFLGVFDFLHDCRMHPKGVTGALEFIKYRTADVMGRATDKISGLWHEGDEGVLVFLVGLLDSLHAEVFEDEILRRPICMSSQE